MTKIYWNIIFSFLLVLTWSNTDTYELMIKSHISRIQKEFINSRHSEYECIHTITKSWYTYFLFTSQNTRCSQTYSEFILKCLLVLYSYRKWSIRINLDKFMVQKWEENKIKIHWHSCSLLLKILYITWHEVWLFTKYITVVLGHYKIIYCIHLLLIILVSSLMSTIIR